MVINGDPLHSLLASPPHPPKISNDYHLSIITFPTNSKDQEAGYQVACGDLITDLLHDINLTRSKQHTNKYNLAPFKNLLSEVTDDIKALKK